MSKTDEVIAVVDGSYSDETKLYSYGVVVSLPDGTELARLNGIGDDEQAKPERNVAGEVLSATKAIEWANANGYHKLLIKHDYKGIGDWVSGQWKANSYCATKYKKFVDEMKTKIEIDFIKVPRSEVKEADKLAAEARTKR
ncbi:hypothetical protein FACS189487_09000 [Campylobacterota bacterium]|nr:hypothetical protein FACS189487_09000 [Campylobacterota bacterium]